jgi:hypothetical protein
LADNTVLSAAVGTGDTLQTDDLGSYKIAASKITLGANNSDDGYVSGIPCPSRPADSPPPAPPPPATPS